MTRSQIARVLREAAMYAHYNGLPHPHSCIIHVCASLDDVYDVDAAFGQFFSVPDFCDATTDQVVLALLFAAEAVEEEE